MFCCWPGAGQHGRARCAALWAGEGGQELRRPSSFPGSCLCSPAGMACPTFTIPCEVAPGWSRGKKTKKMFVDRKACDAPPSMLSSRYFQGHLAMLFSLSLLDVAQA